MHLRVLESSEKNIIGNPVRFYITVGPNLPRWNASSGKSQKISKGNSFGTHNSLSELRSRLAPCTEVLNYPLIKLFRGLLRQITWRIVCQGRELRGCVYKSMRLMTSFILQDTIGARCFALSICGPDLTITCLFLNIDI